LDGSINIKFYSSWIDLIEAVQHYIENPLYAEKLYHEFEMKQILGDIVCFKRPTLVLFFSLFNC